MKILQICYNEFKEIFSDIGIVIFVIILPLAYPLLYAYVYDNEVVREVPVVVVDDSQTKVSREFLRRCDASPDIKIISHATGMENARTYLKGQTPMESSAFHGSFPTTSPKATKQ